MTPCRIATLVVASFLMAACAGLISFGGSRTKILEWAAERDFTAGEIVSGPFRLLELSRSRRRSPEALTVYIEGDGAPWATPFHPPRDPTPDRPLALILAHADPSPSVVYLGRPCQYLDAIALSACDSAWWTTKRFAPEVVAAYEEALNVVKQRYGANRLKLVGHSGGGVIATLLAYRRSDIEQLVTLGAPLALAEWTTLHDIAPLGDASDPAQQIGSLPSAVHLVGERDSTVPPAIVESFVRKKGGRLRVIPGYGHACCWERTWPKLLEEMLP